ncbi:MAG: hypothetical protein VB013_04485 [Anaerolineaceae bacterium]|nr:hypothetical protein [Anaerolineaceae bacterium]
MLVAFLIILYILSVLTLYGQGLFLIFSKKFPALTQPSLPFLFVVGLMVVTTLGSFASLFIRLNWEFQTALFVGAIALLIWNILRRTPLPRLHLNEFSLLQKLGLAFFVAVEIVLLYLATLTPSNADTGIYHAQTIHWIEAYPVVPGLANLHQRFGYDSSWLLANAIFSLAFLNLQSFHLLMGAFFIVMAGYFYGGIHELLAGKYRLSNLMKLGFFLALFFYLIDQVSSPGTDAPTTLMIFFILTETVRCLEDRLAARSLPYIFLALLAFFCATFKLSSVPLLVLVLALCIQLNREKDMRSVGWIALAAFVILLPYVVRNFILTGYPVFPGFPFILFNFDWTVPIEQVGTESRVIHWFAMLPHTSLSKFEAMSKADQIIKWYHNLLPRQKAILLATALAAGADVLLLFVKKWRETLKQNKGFLLVFGAALLGCLFWFITAPAFRFGYGFLLSTLFLFGFLPVSFFLPKFQRWQIGVGAALLIVCVGAVFSTVRPEINVGSIKETIVMPAAYPGISSEPCTFANFKMLCQVSYEECWYSPFPCAIKGNDHVAMRSNDYRDGFKYIK